MSDSAADCMLEMRETEMQAVYEQEMKHVSSTITAGIQGISVPDERGGAWLMILTSA